jgi:peroxiredoxin
MKKLLGTCLFAFLTITLFVAAGRPFGEGYKVGAKIENFSLKNVDGNMVSLSDYEAEGYVIIFTCNTCPYAVMYEDRIIDLHKKYVDKGFPVVAINPNDPAVKSGDSFEAMQVRAEEKEFPFNYLFDEDQSVYPKFGATRTPHVFIVDKNMILRYIGAIDNNAQDASAVTIRYVEDAIEAIMKGEQPDPEMTKAIGCSIKVKS